MKKAFLILMLCTIAGISVMSCNSSLSKEVKDDNTHLYGNLEVFKTVNSVSKKTMLGVKNAESGTIIISPRECDSITADKHVIFCHNSKYSVNVYNHNGEEIGDGFEMFSYWNQNGEYYLGTNYKTNTYYFPSTKEVVKCAPNSSLQIEGQYMFLKTPQAWEIRDKDGKFVYKAPHNSYIICMNIDINKSEVSIVIPEKVNKWKTIYVMRDLDNKEIARFSERDWMKNQTAISKKAKFINFNIPEDNKS